MEAHCSTSFAGLPEGVRRQWDDLVRHGEYALAAEQLRLTERTAPTHYYALTCDGTLMGGGVGNIVTERSRPQMRIDLKVADDPLAARLLPSLHIGGMLPRATGILVRDGAAPDVMAKILTHFEALARHTGSRSISVTYAVTDGALARALAGRDFTMIPGAPVAVLDIAFSGFDDYLSTFRANRRNAIKRERKALSRMDLIYRVVALDNQLSLACAPLAAANKRRHGASATVEQVARSNLLLAREMPGRVELVCASLADGPVVAFAAFIQWRDEIYQTQVGLDYNATRGSPIYFEVVFYQMIELAIARGVSRIDYGQSVEIAKGRRGCHLAPRSVFVKELSR